MSLCNIPDSHWGKDYEREAFWDRVIKRMNEKETKEEEEMTEEEIKDMESKIDAFFIGS
jgi:hypothetical protein